MDLLLNNAVGELLQAPLEVHPHENSLTASLFSFLLGDTLRNKGFGRVDDSTRICLYSTGTYLILSPCAVIAPLC